MNKMDLVDKSLMAKKSDSLSYLEDVHAKKVGFEVDAGNVSTLSTKLMRGNCHKEKTVVEQNVPQLNRQAKGGPKNPYRTGRGFGSMEGAS